MLQVGPALTGLVDKDFLDMAIIVRFARRRNARGTAIPHQRPRPGRRLPVFRRGGGPAREGLHGWVRNLPDGRVEIAAEGDAEALERFERAVRQGPRGARVERRWTSTRPSRDTRYRVQIVTSTMDHLKADDSPRPRLPEGGHSVLRHHHAAAGSRWVPRRDRQPAAPFRDQGIDLVVGIESRGFIFGAAVADRIGAGFSPVRKPGKLPSTTVRATYDLEYGTDSLEIHDDAVRRGSGCSSSTICWPPAARRAPRWIW